MRFPGNTGKAVQRGTPRTATRVFKKWTVAVPGMIVAIYLLVALFGPVIAPYDPVATNLTDRLLCPGCETSSGSIAWLGTDATGRDMFGQIVAGTRTSVLIGSLTVSLCALVGLIIGLPAGYFGGLADLALSRVIDILIAFPSIVLAIVVAGLFPRGLGVVVVALSLSGWVSFARLSRSATMSTKEREWVAAARVMGVPARSVLVRHVLPFLAGPMVALIALEFGLIILGEAGLSFLGIGLPASTVSWGQSIASGKEYLATAWWISAFPGIALALLVIMVGLLGDQLNSRYQRGGSR